MIKMYNAYLPPLKEDMIMNSKGNYMVNLETTPVRNHQTYEDLLQFQKEFAAEIYFQRDREGRIP